MRNVPFCHELTMVRTNVIPRHVITFPGMSRIDIIKGHSKRVRSSGRQYLTTKQDVIWIQQDVIWPIVDRSRMIGLTTRRQFPAPGVFSAFTPGAFFHSRGRA